VAHLRARVVRNPSPAPFDRSGALVPQPAPPSPSAPALPGSPLAHSGSLAAELKSGSPALGPAYNRQPGMSVPLPTRFDGSPTASAVTPVPVFSAAALASASSASASPLRRALTSPDNAARSSSPFSRFLRTDSPGRSAGQYLEPPLGVHTG